jgi:hypothetical protein
MSTLLLLIMDSISSGLLLGWLYVSVITFTTLTVVSMTGPDETYTHSHFALTPTAQIRHFKCVNQSDILRVNDMANLFG